MIESISHITFIVKDVQRTADMLRYVLDAKEIYDSAEKNFSVAYEKFFLIGGTWVAIMEGDPHLERTYNHLSFKVKEAQLEDYIRKIRKSGLDTFEGRQRIDGESCSVYFYDYDKHLFELHAGSLYERLSRYGEHSSHSGSIRHPGKTHRRSP